MNRKILTIIIIVAFIVFVVLVGALILSNQVSNKNVTAKPIVKTSQSANKSSQNTSPASNQSATSTVTNEQSQVSNAGNKTAIKALILQQLVAPKNITANNISNAYKSVEQCADLATSSDKDICVTLWAEYLKDPNTCLKTSDAGRQSCQDRAYIAKAEANKDASLCIQVKSSDAKETCIAKLVTLAGLAEKDCTALPNAEDLICMTDIYTLKAQRLSDCDNIVDPRIKQLCRAKFYSN